MGSYVRVTGGERRNHQIHSRASNLYTNNKSSSVNYFNGLQSPYKRVDEKREEGKSKTHSFYRMARTPVAFATSENDVRAGLVAAMGLVVCVVGLLMCASHALRWPSRRNKQGPVIQLDMDAGMMIDDGQGDAIGPPLCVWQKNILMGEKCQLPDFSGIIIYDSTGNLIPTKPPPPHHTSSK
ncbi:hypothetical protein ACLOJK_019821 [Asimina triloba]